MVLEQADLRAGGGSERIIMQTWTPLCDAFSHAGANSVCTQNTSLLLLLLARLAPTSGPSLLSGWCLAAFWQQRGLAFPTSTCFEWTRRWTALPPNQPNNIEQPTIKAKTKQKPLHDQLLCSLAWCRPASKPPSPPTHLHPPPPQMRQQ